MAKAKATKRIDVSVLIAGIIGAFDVEVSARKARITALRDWSIQVAGLRPLSDDDDKWVRTAIAEAYASKGLKEKSAAVMASQDMRFLRAYLSDAKFRALADTVDDVRAAFPKGRTPAADSALKRAFRAIKKEKLDNRTVALDWIAKHPQNAIVLIENYLKEQSQLSAGLQAVVARSETKREKLDRVLPAVRTVRVRKGAAQSQQVAA